MYRERQQPDLWYPFLLMNTFIKVENFLEYGAYVNVVFKTGVTRADCEKFNEAIFTIMEEDLKVPKENVYTTFQYCDDFGVQGKFL